MADAELETFTSIMDALVRISVSMTLISTCSLPAFKQTVRPLKRLTGASSPSFVHPTCRLVDLPVIRCDPSRHMVQIVTEELKAIRFPLQFLLPLFSKSVYS